MKDFLTSFRGRLTLWSMAVLGAALVSFSLILSLVSLNRMRDGIDRELRDRAYRSGGPGGGFAPGWQPGQGGPPPGRGGGGQQQGAGFGGNPPPPAGPQGGSGQAGRVQLPPALEPGEPGPEFILDLRRPRFIDLKGKVQGGFFDNQAFDPKAVDKALKGEDVYSEVQLEGRPLRVFSAPWRREGERLGVVQVARDLKDYEDLKRTQMATLFMLLPFALIATAAGAFLLVGRGIRPIGAMRSAAIKVGEGDLSQRLEVVGEDELAQLGKAFNEMAGRLQLSFDEQKAAFVALQEAYESQRRFTADASHELRTPLSRLQLATSSALSGPAEGYKAALEKADQAAQTMSKLVKELLTLARADAGQLGLHHEPIDLRLAASNAVNQVARPVEVHLASGAVTVLGDEDHLERCIQNLLENAVRHTPEDGLVSVRVLEDGESGVIEVSDTGTGISPEHLPHVFERFYRADPARGRTESVGLGLAICQSVVEAHGGRIAVESRVGEGTTFTIKLPLRR